MTGNWVLATWMASFREAFGKRTAFWLDLFVMTTNDAVWLVIYSVFFNVAGPINGWERHDLFMLFAVVTATWGLTSGLFANVRFLGRMAANGELDAALTIPVDTLTYLLVRKVRPSNLGDLVFGISLFTIAGNLTLERMALFLVAIILSSIVLASFLVLVGSTAFLTGGRGEQTQAASDAIMSFSMYPSDWFGGAIKMLIYTAIPAGFVGTMPARMVSDFTWADACVLVVVTITFALAARLTFSASLRHYRSGSHWTTA